jgi:hypothetical protein
MSENYASKVVTAALNEEGYLEKSAAAYKKDPTILDRKTDGAGSDNYTKYGRDMHKIYPSVMDFPAYWCDAFIDWLFYMTYGVTTAKSLLAGDFNDYTVASCQMYEKKNALGTDPKYGAQVFFTKNGKSNGCHHTGLVYKVDDTYFYTIEGNTSGASGVVSNGGGVAKKKYKISSYKGKVLFGYPKYDAEPTKTKKTDTTKYYKACSSKVASFVDGLIEVGESDTSKTHRTKIAKANGITSYSGTAEQNTKLLALLKKGKLIKA